VIDRSICVKNRRSAVGGVHVPSSVERRSSTSARGFMLSRLSDAAAEAGDRSMSLAMAAAGSNGPLWSTLLHCSEKDVDTSETVRLRLPAVSTRLRVDGDEQQPPPRSPAGPASELSSETETDELLSLSMAGSASSPRAFASAATPPLSVQFSTAQDKRNTKMAL
jgi:hypothetical protein